MPSFKSWKMTIPLEHLYVCPTDDTIPVPEQYLDSDNFQIFVNRNRKNDFDSTVYISKNLFNDVIDDIEYSNLIVEVYFIIDRERSVMIATLLLFDDPVNIPRLFNLAQSNGIPYNITIEDVDPSIYLDSI